MIPGIGKLGNADITRNSQIHVRKLIFVEFYGYHLWEMVWNAYRVYRLGSNSSKFWGVGNKIFSKLFGVTCQSQNVICQDVNIGMWNDVKKIANSKSMLIGADHYPNHLPLTNGSWSRGVAEATQMDLAMVASECHPGPLGKVNVNNHPQIIFGIPRIWLCNLMSHQLVQDWWFQPEQSVNDTHHPKYGWK